MVTPNKGSTFAQLVKAKLPIGMALPDEFSELFDWIENNGGTSSYPDGRKYAVIEPSQINRQGGSSICFQEPYDNHWMCPADTNPKEAMRLRPFLRTGGDGSCAAFWLDDQGVQRIVHIGSGSGSIIIGIWVETPLDLLKLLAVGYEELCWEESYDQKPIDACYEPGNFSKPSLYRAWLSDKYGITIPNTAAEIVNDMSKMGEPSDDPFCIWAASLNDRG